MRLYEDESRWKIRFWEAVLPVSPRMNSALGTSTAADSAVLMST